MLLLLILFNQSILINEATLEAMWGDKHKFISKIISLCIILILGFFGYLLSNFNLEYTLLTVIVYLGQRVATFDYMFPIIKYKNLKAMWYLGTTSEWDIWLSQFNKYYILMFRLLVLFASILTFLLATKLLNI